MHAVVLVVVLGLPAVLIAAIVLLISDRVGPPQGHEATVVAARRHETRIAAAAAASSICALIALGNPWATSWLPSGVLLGLAPFVAALVLAVARAVGETRWPRPTGAVRQAPLVRRSVRDQGGWRLPVFLGTAAGLVVVLVVFGLTAADDGRSVERATLIVDVGLVSSGAGPYPGWALGGPALPALLLAVAATLVALRAVTRRPPIGLLTVEQDDAIRRTSAARLLAGAQTWVGLGAAGHLAFAGGALLQVGWDVFGIVCLALALVALAGSVVVGVSALPSRRPRVAVPGTRAATSGSGT